MLTKRMIEDVIRRQLENKTFDEILEDFDLTPEQVFFTLFKLGYIDQELMERIYD